MHYGTPTHTRTDASPLSRWFVALCSLFIALAMATGSSAAIAKSPKHGGSDSKATSHGERSWSSHTQSRHSWKWQKCLRHSQVNLAYSKRIDRIMKQRLINQCVRRANNPLPVTKPEAPKPEPAPAKPVMSSPAPVTSTPEADSPAPSGAIASASNAGVPGGTNLAASGGMKITKSGTVVDGKDIKGDIWIDADNVTIKNSRIVGSGFSVIQIKNGSSGVKIQNVEIDGQGRTSGAMGVMGPADVSGADIKGVENGLTPGSGSVLRGNYVHDLKSPGSPHYDGIQIDGGLSNITIEKNHVDMSEHGQTAAVMIDNYFGPIKNIAVNGNILRGGGYTVYSSAQFTGGSVSGVSFTNNRLGKGHWGYASIEGNTVVWSGNVDYSSGKVANK